ITRYVCWPRTRGQRPESGCSSNRAIIKKNGALSESLQTSWRRAGKHWPTVSNTKCCRSRARRIKALHLTSWKRLSYPSELSGEIVGGNWRAGDEEGRFSDGNLRESRHFEERGCR